MKDYAVIVSLVTAAAALASDAGTNRPQWRGPNGRGVSEERGLPTEWNATKKVRWKTPLAGRGHSSPIVWDNGYSSRPRPKGPWSRGRGPRSTSNHTFDTCALL